MLQDKYVEDLISRLGLVKSADTIVGDAKTRGISGAQEVCWMVTSRRLAARRGAGVHSTVIQFSVDPLTAGLNAHRRREEAAVHWL